MFESLDQAPPDPILGLTEAFNQDPNPGKINLGVGVFQDENGNTPVLASVKEAERRLLELEKTKRYKPITGDPVYGRAVQELVLGAGHPVIQANRAFTAHCPGGTGALRVAADFLVRMLGRSTIWVSEPTWANHPKIFQASGLSVKTYPYFDPRTNDLDWAGMQDRLSQIPAGDVVLLHGCCHNPTGVDLQLEHWRKVGDLLAARRALPLIDFAYQGFGAGLTEDALGIRTLCEMVPEAIICSSFSKNFGLYSERTGAATFVAASPEQADIVLSNVKICIRTNYSNPPAHGAAIVATVLNDAELRQRWVGELAAMRQRIHDLRQLFAETLQALGSPLDGSFIKRQNGMFSMSGLTADQAQALRKKHSIYIVNSGRISVAGMTAPTMKRLCEAIVDVL